MNIKIKHFKGLVISIIGSITINITINMNAKFQTFSDTKVGKNEGISIRASTSLCGTIKITPSNKQKKIKLYAYHATNDFDTTKKEFYTKETLRGSVLLSEKGDTFDFDWGGSPRFDHYRIFTKEILKDGREINVPASTAVSIEIIQNMKPCKPPMNYGELKMNAA